MSPDRWMSPKVTRHRVPRGLTDGMRICTSRRVGAPGASVSLTPTAVTAFLLDVCPRPYSSLARQIGPVEQSDTPSLLRTLDSGSSGPAETARWLTSWWVTARLVGVELRRDRRRLGGLHGMRYPLHSFLNRAPDEILPASIRDSRSGRSYINREFVTRAKRHLCQHSGLVTSAREPTRPAGR